MLLECARTMVGIYIYQAIVPATRTLDRSFYPDLRMRMHSFAESEMMGEVIWARSGGEYDNDQATRVNISPNGRSDLCCRSVPGLCILWSHSSYLLGVVVNIFISSLDSSGNFIWVENFGNYSDDIGYAVDIDSMGNVYAGGFYYSDYLNFGSTVLANHGEFDCFLTKLNSYGSVCWAKDIGGPNTEVIRPLKVDGPFFILEDTIMIPEIFLELI